MLADVFPLGSWNNLVEMEESLTLDELFLLIEARYKRANEDRKFSAALQGVDLDDAKEENPAFDEIQRKAQADLAGKTEEEFVFDLIGIEIDTDDE
jgi:hypothetical protein